MKKTNKISTKIKLLGASLIFLMLSVIMTTIYLNQQNAKDALVVNIVGKERMLTQKMSKNVFYIYYSGNKDFKELDSAVDEFIRGLSILEDGDEQRGISSVPTFEIAKQLLVVDKLWEAFYKDIQKFQHYIQNDVENKEEKLKEVVDFIYKNNTILLDNVDKLVTLYTLHSENKTEAIRTFQYISGGILFFLFIYSMLQLREIESHVDKFMQYSKMLVNDKDGSKLQPITLEKESEEEIVEVSDTINCFIKKINSAVDYSSEALLQSQQASQKLDELTEEFDTILDELQDSSLISKHLNTSEDIAIESTEGLLNSTKRLQKLKKELEELTKSCQALKAQ